MLLYDLLLPEFEIGIPTNPIEYNSMMHCQISDADFGKGNELQCVEMVCVVSEGWLCRGTFKSEQRVLLYCVS